VYVPAFVGAAAVPDPAVPAVEPEKYSSVAAGDRFVSLPTPSTVAVAGCVALLYVAFDHVMRTVAAALSIVIVRVAEVEL
jgi:hypothetical protein